MYNWSVDEEALKDDPEAYAIWALEQQINYGLQETKINERELRRLWPKLSLDPARRRFLALLLYGQTDSHRAADQAA